MNLKYYADKKYAPLSDILRQASINTENQLMAVYESSWKYCPNTGRSIGSYIIFYQGKIIDHGTYITGTIVQSIS